MRWWKAGLAFAAAGLLTGCGSERAPPTPRESLAPTTAAADPPVLAPPVEPSVEVSPSASASASPEPTPSASPVADAGKPLKSYPPRDECARLPGFAAFRDKVFAATKARDAEALVALADPAIHLDFGGGAGRDELKKRLSAADTPLWGEIAALSGLGCALDRGVATLPWIFARIPDAVDPYKAMLVTGRGVPLREKAAAGAATRRTLDWAVVALVGTGFDPKAAFAEVSAGGERGFVETAKLRSLLGYRLIADRGEGEWRLTAFIAGD